MSHDLKRNGPASLCAALKIVTGEVTGSRFPMHTHNEFLAFLNGLVRAYAPRPLHVVLKNSSTHSTLELKRWLERRPRVHFHFTRISSLWMNMVEIWFSIATKQQVRRDVHDDVPDLIAATEHFINGYNERAIPLVWTKTGPDQSTRHCRRGCTRMHAAAQDLPGAARPQASRQRLDSAFIP